MIEHAPAVTIDRVAAPGNADPRAREVRRARPPLVGSAERVRAAARHQSAAARLDRALAGGLRANASLDVGCGGGILAEAMALRGAQVIGIDSPRRRSASPKLHADESGRASITARSRPRRSPGNAGAFDVVTCMELLEHVPDPASIVAACARSRKPGGCVFSTINRNPKSYALAILGAEYVLRLLPRGTHDWSRFVRPSELAGSRAARGSSSR